MRRSIIYLIALVCIAGAAQAQVRLDYGPNDTLHVEIFAKDSLGNGVAIDSAHDSGYVVVYQPAHVGTSDSMKCYEAKFLLDASTSSTQLRTSGRGGSVGETYQVFSWFSRVYTITNSATTSGQYNYKVAVRDSSLKLWTYFSGSFNYVYGGTNTSTLAGTIDSLLKVIRRIDTTLSWAFQNYVNVSKIGGQTASAAAGITFPSSIASPTNITSASGVSLAADQAVDVQKINGSASAADSLADILTGTTRKMFANLTTGVTLDSGTQYGAAANTMPVATSVTNAVTVTGTPAVNMTQIGGVAVSTSTAQIGVNTVNVGGTAQTGRDLGASVLLSNGTGTGQISLTSGRVDVGKVSGTTQTALDLAAYMVAIADTMMMANGQRVGCKAKYRTAAAADTCYVYAKDGVTLMFKTVIYHPGGAPADYPNDTTKCQ